MIIFFVVEGSVNVPAGAGGKRLKLCSAFFHSAILFHGPHHDVDKYISSLHARDSVSTFDRVQTVHIITRGRARFFLSHTLFLFHHLLSFFTLIFYLSGKVKLVIQQVVPY